MSASPTAPAATPYVVPRHPAPVDLWLASNEGRTPAGLDLALDPATLARYPRADALQQRLAARLGLAPEQVLVTSGADDGLLRLCLAELGPGRRALVASPTFEMIPRYVALAGGALDQVPWPAGPFPTETLVSAVGPDTALVFVVTPNNPTGAVAARADLERVAAAAPDATVVLDHAYVELGDEDLTAAALALPNVVVLRTFSKAWGLAGLRVGYALGDPALLQRLAASGNPFAVASASLALAGARLDSGERDMADYVARVRAEREELFERLAAHGLAPVPSQANFVLARGERAHWLRDALAGLGIAVRVFPGVPGLEDAVRITCPGEPAAFERLLASIDAALAPEALLLDMDGVLADVSGSYRRAILETAAGYGVTLTPADVERAKARGGANDDWDLTRRLLAERGVERPLAEVTERFEAIYQVLRDGEELLADREALQRWRATYPLAVVTGRPRADALHFLEVRGVADLFDAVVTREDGPLKPDPAPVRTALARLGATRGWMLGDTVDDLAAARAADGVVPVGVLPPGADAPTLTDTLLRAGAARVLPTTTSVEELLP